MASKRNFEQEIIKAIDNKQWDYVIHLCSTALQDDPNNAVILSYRGGAYNEKREHDKAIDDCDKAIELDPRYANAYNYRGEAYAYKGKYDKAIADCDKAIELNPEYADGYSNRGSIYHAKGEYDKAIADCNKAIELDQKHAFAYNNRGHVYHAKGEYDKAIADCDKAIELDPRNAVFYINRGTTYNAKGEYDKARQNYSKALEVDPINKIAFVRLGYNREIEEKKEELENVRQEFKQKTDNLEKQLEEQLGKEFSDTNIVEYVGYKKLMAEYDKQYSDKERNEADALEELKFASRNFYSAVSMLWLIFVIFIPDIWYALFPLLLAATFLTFPYIWQLHIARRDKHKYWALREDARSKQALMALAMHTSEERKDAVTELFNHHNQHHSADLVVKGWKNERPDSSFTHNITNHASRETDKN